ncbi:MAG: HD domain-containing protein [Dissulfurispiraceae bacterium]|jgi:hypothetical protein
MNNEDFIYFKDWFSAFCKSFYLDDDNEQKNIALKETHTHRVCDNIVTVAQGESLDAGRMLIAETVALFHDIGRFPQYARYKTFRDSISVNHGLLGSTILKEQKILERLPEQEQNVIIDAVKLHNAFAIADIADAETLLFLKLIRDADKLDIWKIFIEFYGSPEGERPDAVGLGLPDVPSCSDEIFSYIRKKQVASHSSIKSLNDFKLLQLSWIFDLNFRSSYTLLQKRDYIIRIASTLPRTDDVIAAVADIQTYAEEKLRHG